MRNNIVDEENFLSVYPILVKHNPDFCNSLPPPSSLSLTLSLSQSHTLSLSHSLWLYNVSVGWQWFHTIPFWGRFMVIAKFILMRSFLVSVKSDILLKTNIVISILVKIGWQLLELDAYIIVLYLNTKNYPVNVIKKFVLIIWDNFSLTKMNMDSYKFCLETQLNRPHTMKCLNSGRRIRKALQETNFCWLWCACASSHKVNIESRASAQKTTKIPNRVSNFLLVDIQWKSVIMNTRL
jgi:hypothetical protein